MDLEFIKKVAADYGHQISDEQAKVAHEAAVSQVNSEEYYYFLKEYFGN